MTLDQVIAANRATRQKHPENLMARHFDEDYFRGLDEPSRQRLTRIIASGIENPDSQMGAYAMNPDDYDKFAPMLDPMIRDFHGLPVETAIAQQHDWDTSSTSCDLGAIDRRLKDVSMRVRVARNLSTFPLPGAMSKEQRVALEDLAAAAFENLREDALFGGRYLSITPGSPHEIDAEEYDRRVGAHQMFKDMSGDSYLNTAGISADWPHGRGMYVSKAEDFLVWVGEEDHLRIMAMQRGGNLNAMFERLRIGLERLQDLLPAFATSPSYGNVTSCPTNLGAGMRASLHMKLPKLTSNGHDLARVKREAKTLGLAVRGAGGEHSDAGQDGLVDISPSARLGVTEMKIMRRLYGGAAALWEMETA
ncbi:MAG: arginine kinase [Rhodobacteraceae bacterium]|nr:arginine kinase [Paracoccaceae bacterium]